MQNRPKIILKWVWIMYRFWQIYIDKSLSEFGIWSGQYIFLICLYHGDWVSQDYISKWLNLDKGTTAKALKVLETQWFVKKKIDLVDKRIHRIFLTKKWKNFKDILHGILSDWSEVLSKWLNKQQESQAIDLLTKMSENAINYFNCKTLHNKKR